MRSSAASRTSGRRPFRARSALRSTVSESAWRGLTVGKCGFTYAMETVCSTDADALTSGMGDRVRTAAITAPTAIIARYLSWKDGRARASLRRAIVVVLGTPHEPGASGTTVRSAERALRTDVSVGGLQKNIGATAPRLRDPGTLLRRGDRRHATPATPRSS